MRAWKRASGQCPCPVCRRTDWCLISPDGSAAICPRVEQGAVRRAGDAGWLHRIGGGDKGSGPTGARTLHISPPVVGPDMSDVAQHYADALRPHDLQRLVDSLGVSADSLRRLQIGWDGAAWTFPMRAPAGVVVGIRRRLPDGRKLSVKGGHEGLFIPDGLDRPDLLLICEGPTDTAALLDLGFAVVGRPSCTGGTRHLVALIRVLAPTIAVIVADADEPGQRGASRLASALALYCRDVRIITPAAPHKDARAWKQAGANKQDIEQAIKAAPQRRLSVRCQKVGV